MYNINAGVGNYAQYYPGSSYADLVSWDSYPVNTADLPLYNDLLATGKPILVAETGASPNASSIPPYSFDNDSILNTIKSSFPKVIGVVVWCQNLALSQQQGDEAFMTDSAILTLADLPASL
jgi:beta-mannanase